MKKLVLAAMAAFTVAGAFGAASATVIDFESLRMENNFANDVGTSYSEDGFTITQGFGEPFSFRSFGTDEFRFTGSTALYNNTVDGIITLTQDGGGAFGVTSIDLSELNGSESADVVFTGLLQGGGSVMETFTLDAIFGIETFLFSSDFDNILSLSWVQSAGFHQFDNIVIANAGEVPLPAALPLFLTALAGFGAAARRKRSA